MEVVVGTAGHIDHGKTSLVKALTGVETDRLPEEKQRGITIDLGFAELRAGDIRFGFVDVPGHERFVKNMLAGATGIDLVLLVVAADEGVMPQTREHFEICRLLGVTSGLVAITKTDMVDDETLELARLDVSELVAGTFLQGSPMIDVSSKSGSGLDDLRTALALAAASVERTIDNSVVRLPIDRSFTVKGFGTVVTGTLASGKLSAGDEVEILPGQRAARVRGLEMHGENTKTAHRGSRVAVNLAGVSRDEIERGMTLSEPAALRPAQVIDTEIEVLASAGSALRTRRRVRVNIGTAEVLARLSVLNDAGQIEPGASDFVQVRFESPVASVPGERFIIRSYSPAATIAGGRVITNLANKHRRREFETARAGLFGLRSSLDDPEEYLTDLVKLAGVRGLGFESVRQRTGIRSTRLKDMLAASVKSGSIVDCGGYFIDLASFSDLKRQAVEILNAFHAHETLTSGMPLDSLREKIFQHAELKLAGSVIGALVADRAISITADTVRLASHRSSLTSDEYAAVERLRAIYRTAGVEVPRVDEAVRETAAATGLNLDRANKIFRHLVEEGELIKVNDDIYILAEYVNKLVEKLREQAIQLGDPLIDVPKFKELAGVSRKYAIPLLEYFDRAQVTRRTGDKRVILR